MRRIRDSSRYGFTLKKLLVVISVIALLITLLLPTEGAREATRIAMCATQLHQIHIGPTVFAGHLKQSRPRSRCCRSMPRPRF